MTNAERSCDLCLLPVADETYRLQTQDGVKSFCCEGCLGIYKLLNGANEDSETPSALVETQRGDSK